MDYNARASQQFRSQNQGSRGANGSQGKQKKEESDDFMRLTDREIAGCISDIGVPFTEADLQRPQPQQIQRVFEWFAELLMNTTRETVDPAMRAAAEDVCGEHADIVPLETRNLMGFYASLRKLLIECGVTDFALSDLYRPTHPRLVKIFSYIINFVRFRESQTDTIDRYFNALEQTKARIDTLYADNQDMEARLRQLHESRRDVEQQAQSRVARNEELKARLLELKKGQERVAVEMERLKTDKAHLASTLQERTERQLCLAQEAERLRPYALQSSAALQAQLAQLGDSLTRDKAQADVLERRARALHTSADTFGLAAHDISPCIALLTGLAADLTAEEREAQEAARRRDALAERGSSVREVERTEALLQKQLTQWLARTEALRSAAGERQSSAQQRMGELRALHRHLVDERAERGREVERRRVRIEQTEKKMADLKDNIEAEILAARDEYVKMDSHIKLYITDMEQAV